MSENREASYIPLNSFIFKHQGSAGRVYGRGRRQQRPRSEENARKVSVDEKVNVQHSGQIRIRLPIAEERYSSRWCS